jgi:DNA repair protein RadD
MSKTWGYLGKAVLQRYIDPSILERLEYLLPVLQTNINNDTIYTRTFLTHIFDAFVAPELIPKRKFREILLNSLPEQLIEHVYSAVGFQKQTTFSGKVNELSKVCWARTEQVEKFISSLDLSPDLVPVDKQLPEENRLIVDEFSRYKPLKDFQTTVYFDSLTQLEHPRSRFVLQMPTGSGKTRTAIEIICNVLAKSPPRSIVVWLAHSEELCEQAYECFFDVWHHVKNKDLRLIRAWGSRGKLPLPLNESWMIIGGFQKVNSLLNSHPELFSALQKDVKLIVVDEAHKVVAPTYKKATMAFVGDSTSVIGLTATPGRSSIDEEQNEDLATFFFKKMVSIKTEGESVIKHLRNRGILSYTKYSPLITNLNYTLTSQEQSHLERFFDLPKGFLKRIGNDDVRNLEIIKTIQFECAKDKQILFFACSVEHSKFIAALLSVMGIKASHIDGKVPKGKRSSIIKAFRLKKTQVVCNYGVLSTGFDAPATDLVFISRPTASVVLYSQMIGRGLRGPEIGGTQYCKIIDVKDNIAGFGNEDFVYQYFDEYYCE